MRGAQGRAKAGARERLCVPALGELSGPALPASSDRLTAEPSGPRLHHARLAGSLC